jgi:hypothetical protein
MSLVRLAVFSLFLILGAAMLLAARTRYARAAERAFIGYFAVLLLVAGLGNRDLWPFSSYPIIAESSLRYREAVWYELRGVDANGVEHRVEVPPLMPTVLNKWMERTFIGTLDDAGRKRAASFLLSRINAPPCTILGPLSAPDWLLERGAGVSPARGPSSGRDARSPLASVALRVYRNDFSQRTLLYECRR